MSEPIIDPEAIRNAWDDDAETVASLEAYLAAYTDSTRWWKERIEPILERLKEANE